MKNRIRPRYVLFPALVVVTVAIVSYAAPACCAPTTAPASRPASKAAPPTSLPAAFDHSALDLLLKRYVVGERVDYGRLKASAEDQTMLSKYIARLGAADPTGWSRNEKLAFYINAYNGIPPHLGCAP